MDQGTYTPNTTGAAQDVAYEPDLELRDFVSKRLEEAGERVSFHDREAERWRRIGRACGAAATQLDQHEPVVVTTAEHFVGDSQKKRLG